MTLYRGQVLSIDNVTKLQKKIEDVCSLPTASYRRVQLNQCHLSADECSSRNNMVDVFFVMIVDPITNSETLFSLYTVFRIEDVLQLDNEQRLFQVRLKLTDEYDS